MNEALWAKIVRTAIAGTERSPLPEALLRALEPTGLPAFSPEKNPGTENLPDPAHTALEALAALHLLRKAALRSPDFPVKDIPPAVEESMDTPYLSPAGTADLAYLLRTAQGALLEEFLGLLARSGRRLPPDMLPDLLEFAVRYPSYAEQIQRVLGPRGSWLARLNPDWAQLAVSETLPDWQTARFAERKRLLAEARFEHPDEARAWLESSWTAETAAHRLAFLELLRNGLSLADEDFLEKARRDKNREVRLAAARLLALLPESRFAQSLAALWQGPLAGFLPSGKIKGDAEQILGEFLAAQLPDIESEPLAFLFSLAAGAQVGSARLAILAVLVRLAPPEWVSAAAGREAAALLPALADLDANSTLLSPLMESAAERRDTAWLAAIGRFLRARHEVKYGLWTQPGTPAVLRALPLEELAQVAQEPGMWVRDLFASTLAERPGPWPRTLLIAVLAQVARVKQGNPFLPDPALARLLAHAAIACKPEDGEIARPLLDGPSSAWKRALEEFLAATAFRQRMHRELSVP